MDYCFWVVSLFRIERIREQFEKDSRKGGKRESKRARTFGFCFCFTRKAPPQAGSREARAALGCAEPGKYLTLGIATRSFLLQSFCRNLLIYMFPIIVKRRGGYGNAKSETTHQTVLSQFFPNLPTYLPQIWSILG